MSAADGTFMCVADAFATPGKSFEEVRMADYIAAYQSTGRPPVPVPQLPADAAARAALGLPPLFAPQPVASTSTSTSALGSALSSSLAGALGPQRIVRAADLPPAQEFRLRAADAERYHAISCMSEYEFFSHEELRFYAYLAGNKTAPHTIKMDPFAPVAAAKDVVATGASLEDKLQSICAQPGFERHSPEELRIAFLLHRRELTSAELEQLQPPGLLAVAAPASLLPPPATPIALSPMPMSALPQPVFATPPSVPKFSFGFK
ncbi:hypothetical protein HYPSUDRAFT_43184 [Hypholoma sublateritium FD-334 SS-4]|uniref:Uncharacterized protein n=1 Tax=Hypholoma sublateritium (strain FD-334 SS-4) TaxID=945553 RepID=A0A0D2PKG9_HYPSF|nr:hypothetical protein HYPSUDRAFT_43184 [Hypholoma sublateritium FD-334 SS-4]